VNDARNVPTPSLVVTAGPDNGSKFAIDHDGETTVGRSPETDVRLTDPSVSRRHAVIRRARDTISIQDLGSRSGTRVNGAEIAGTAVLSDGDFIALGSTTLHFQQPVAIEASDDASTRKTIFISYRRDDAQGYARALYDELSDHYGEGSVFRDLDALAPGEDYAARIDDAISDCDVAVILIGKSWATATDADGRRRLDDPNDLLVQEIAAALKPGRKVLPVLVEGAQMPDESAFPPAIEGLKRLNALEISDSRWRADVDRLFDAIGPAHVAPEPITLQDAEPDKTAAAKPVAIIVGVLALLLVAGFAIFVIAQLNDGGSGDHPRLALEPTSGPAGSQVSATATGFQPGEDVEIIFHAQTVAHGDADENGRFNVVFAVPQHYSPFAPQTFSVTAAGNSSARVAEELFNLTS
jgi:hypothetical protein